MNVNWIIRQLAGQNPSDVYENMMRSNPQFRRFVEENRGKTPQQIAQENGINLGDLARFL